MLFLSAFGVQNYDRVAFLRCNISQEYVMFTNSKCKLFHLPELEPTDHNRWPYTK